MRHTLAPCIDCQLQAEQNTPALSSLLWKQCFSTSAPSTRDRHGLGQKNSKGPAANEGCPGKLVPIAYTMPSEVARRQSIVGRMRGRDDTEQANQFQRAWEGGGVSSADEACLSVSSPLFPKRCHHRENEGVSYKEERRPILTTANVYLH